MAVASFSFTMNPFSILCVRLLLMLCCLLNIEGRRPLNQYIGHYEGLSYNTEALRRQQSLAKDGMMRLHFHSHGRDFDLQMWRDTAQFSPNLTVEVSDDLPMDIGDIDFIYTGQMFSENGTYAHGSVIDGCFEGYIKTRQGTYYVEPSERYFRGRNVSYHSVIYHEDDVHYTYEGGCADQPAAKKMQSPREEPVEERNPVPEHWDAPLPAVAPDPAALLTEEASTCELSIQTDHFFFQRYGTRQKVMEQIANHVKSLNSIYRRTDFGGIRNINFVVKSVLINTSSAANDESNPYANPNLTPEEFLYLFSLQNHDDYCLAYIFTNRNFKKVLGLAWQASVCSTHWCGKEGTKCSKNTGLITVRNGDNHVPPKVSHLVFAHEVGHNLGTPHDTTPECTPGEMHGGNYIMYPMASSGNSPNNKRFSPCSVRAIGENLKRTRRSCFVKSHRPVCGNGLVERDEHCDCGFSDQCKDPCCYDADEDEDKRCKLKPECGPTPSTEEGGGLAELLKAIAKWIVTYWWATLLIGIVLTASMAAFITICRKRRRMASLFV